MQKQNSKGQKKGGLIKIIFLILAISVFAGIYYMSGLNKALSSGDAMPVAVIIPSGSGTERIGEILVEEGIIKSTGKFKLLSKLEGNDGKYKAGEYSLSSSMTPKEIMGIIISGESNTAKFTIPEGFTLKQVSDRLISNGIVTEADLLYELENGIFDHRFMEFLPAGTNRLEGFLYPETYFVYSNASAHDVLDVMLGQFNKLVTDKHYERAKELGYSMYDIVTIASLIERETMVEDEGALVASVIYNRLGIGQPLGIDATIQYALPEHKERLSIADTKVDSPYNTYRHTGLPPGPICSPSLAAIEAALYPADTNYYYYVLSPNKDGRHNFSNSYDEFLKNKRAYKASL